MQKCDEEIYQKNTLFQNQERFITLLKYLLISINMKVFFYSEKREIARLLLIAY